MPCVHELHPHSLQLGQHLSFQLPASAVLSPYKLSSTRTFQFRRQIKHRRRNYASSSLLWPQASNRRKVRMEEGSVPTLFCRFPGSLKSFRIHHIPATHSPTLHTPASDLYHSFTEIIVIVHIWSQTKITKHVHPPTAGGAWPPIVAYHYPPPLTGTPTIGN